MRGARGTGTGVRGRGVGAHATMRLSSLSWVKLPTRLCVTLVGFCACEGRAGIRGWVRSRGRHSGGRVHRRRRFVFARAGPAAAARAGRRSRTSGFFDGDETYRHDVVVRHRCSDPPSGSRLDRGARVLSSGDDARRAGVPRAGGAAESWIQLLPSQSRPKNGTVDDFPGHRAVTDSAREEPATQ